MKVCLILIFASNEFTQLFFGLLLTNFIFAVIKKEILMQAEDKLRTARLLETQDYHIVGKKVIKALLDSKELSRIEFEKCFEKFDDANKVLETNVFAYHPGRNTVTFQSRTVECYIQKNKHHFIQ